MSNTATLRILQVPAELASRTAESISAPAPQPSTAVDGPCEGWDTATCLRAFRKALCDRDSDAAVQCMRAMDRLSCWHEAFEQLTAGRASLEVRGSAVLWLWNSFGLHIADSLRGDRIVATVLKVLLPPYSGTGCTLYRAELSSRLRQRSYGMSWTAELAMARALAAQRGAGCEVLRVRASADMIITPPIAHTKSELEAEYLLDPAMLNSVDVI